MRHDIDLKYIVSFLQIVFIMKFILFITSLVISFLAMAQEKVIYVEYDHGQWLNTFSNKEILIAGMDKASYSIQEIKSIEQGKLTAFDESSNTISKLPFNNVKPTVFYKFKNSNIIYFDDYINDKQYFITDTIPVMNWDLVPDDTKEIEGYTCNKAKLKYRGSEFTAYYTQDIPTTFGPWKFDGLPGLILEIILDDNNTFYWRASKIIYPYTENMVSFEFSKEKYKTALRTFLKEKEKDRDEKQKIFDEKYAKGAVVVRTYKPAGPEKVYEWEKVTEKK